MNTENPCERRQLAEDIGRDATTAQAWLSWHTSAASALVSVPVYAYNWVAYHLEQRRAPHPDPATVKAYRAWCQRQLKRLHTDTECDVDDLAARWRAEAANTALRTVLGLDVTLAIIGALLAATALLVLGGSYPTAIATLVAALILAVYLAAAPRVPAVGPEAPRTGIAWFVSPRPATRPRRPVDSRR